MSNAKMTTIFFLSKKKVGKAERKKKEKCFNLYYPRTNVTIKRRIFYILHIN